MALRQFREQAQRKKEQKSKLIHTVFLIVCALAAAVGIFCFAINMIAMQAEPVRIAIKDQTGETITTISVREASRMFPPMPPSIDDFRNSTPLLAVIGGALMTIGGAFGFILGWKRMNAMPSVIVAVLAAAAWGVFIFDRGVGAGIGSFVGLAVTVVYIAAAVWRNAASPEKVKEIFY